MMDAKLHVTASSRILAASSFTVSPGFRFRFDQNLNYINSWIKLVFHVVTYCLDVELVDKLIATDNTTVYYNTHKTSVSFIKGVIILFLLVIVLSFGYSIILLKINGNRSGQFSMQPTPYVVEKNLGL